MRDHQIKGCSSVWIASAFVVPPSLSVFYCLFLKSRQKMVALAFLIKAAGAERGSSRKLKGEMKLESTDRIPFWRQAGSGRGRGAGGGGQRLGRLRRSIQAGIIEASSASRPSWEVGNCCAGFGLAQLGTEARHCEMYSNLAHFLCLPGMSHYSSIAGKKKKKKIMLLARSSLMLSSSSSPCALQEGRGNEQEGRGHTWS